MNFPDFSSKWVTRFPILGISGTRMVGSSVDHVLEASVSKRLVCAYLATTAPAPFFQKAGPLTAKYPIIPMSKDLFGTPSAHDGL
jgi:hypothetical protein